MSLVPVARQKLFTARTQAGLTQADLAEALGTSQTNISRWEQGLVSPSAFYQQKLCAFFRLSACELGLVDQNQVLATGEESIASVPLFGQHLIGRDQDLSQLRQLLARRHSLVAVTGLPGVGKTALVAALVHDPYIRKQFSDGILWSGLGLTPNKSIFRRWGNFLGIREEEQALLLTSAEWGIALRNAIGPQRILLIIDDAWKEEAAVNFLVGGPNCAHIVTTRFPAIASAIASDAMMFLRELNEEQSLYLLRSLAQTTIEQELEQAQKLIRAVGGLPLALKLMGNYLRKEGRDGQPRRIQAALADLQQVETRLQLTQALSPNEPHPWAGEESSISLYSLLEVSDRHLDDSATRATLYALSVFPEKPATFSEEAALAVCNCVPEELDKLSDAGLLEVSGERYTLHQVIADYARVHLLQQPETHVRESYLRLIDYTLAYAVRYQENMEKLDTECYMYRAALEGADAYGYHMQFVQLAAALATHIRVRMIYTVESYLVRALEIAQTMESHAMDASVLKILEERAHLRLMQGDRATFRSLAQTGTLLARQAGDEKALSTFQNLLSEAESTSENANPPEDTAQTQIAQTDEGDQKQIATSTRCTFSGVVVLIDLKRFLESGVARVECPDCTCTRTLEPHGGVLRFKSHDKRKTHTPVTSQRWVMRETTWGVVGREM